MDEIILFHQLTPEQLAKILDLMLNQEYELAAQQGLVMDVREGAKEWLLAQNNQPEFGARPLRRIIARHLREPLADFLLSSKKDEKAAIVVTADGNGLQFSFKAAVPGD